jgi:hypothetical protein
MLLSQFSAIFNNFGEKMAFFSKTNVMIKMLHYLHSFVLSQKTPIFFAEFFSENILKIITLVPSLKIDFFSLLGHINNLHFSNFFVSFRPHINST